MIIYTHTLKVTSGVISVLVIYFEVRYLTISRQQGQALNVAASADTEAFGSSQFPAVSGGYEL